MSERMRWIVAVAVAVLAMTGCGPSDHDGLHDHNNDHYTDGVLDDTPADVLNMPNMFYDVAHKCDDYGHRVYAGGDGKLVVIDDPSCAR